METLRMLSNSAGGSDYEAEVERLLSCPICLEVYSKPVVILPCQHNLCRKCANDVFQNRGTPMGSGGRFRCPTCRYEVMLDRHGVYGLQRNILVENIIDMYQTDSKKTFRKTEVLMCEEHEGEKVNIFCVTCQKPTCSMCKVFGQHQDCTVSPMEKVYKDHKTELSGAISMLVAGNDRIQTIISNTEEMVRINEEDAKRAQNEVSSEFDKLYVILEQRKQAMLSHIKATSSEKSQVMQSLLTDYGTQLQDSSKLVEEALSLLEEPTHSQFLLVSRDLISRVTSSAREAESLKPSPDLQNTDTVTVDFSEHVEYLEQISFNEADGSAPIQLRECDVSSSSSVCSGDSFQAKLLLPKNNSATEEVVASAKVLKTDDDGENIETSSVSSKCDGAGERHDLHNDCSGFDQLDADVKAIAERYLTTRGSRRRSLACHSGESPEARRNNDEKRLGKLETTGKNDYDDLISLKSFLQRRLSNISSDNASSTKNSSRSSSPSRTETPRKTSSSSTTDSSNRLARVQNDNADTLNASGNSVLLSRDRSPARRGPPPARRLRTYTTHRRRTWSHLLDKKP